MPAGEVSVRLNLNKDGYSAGMTAARKEAAALGDAFEKVGHGGVTQMQAVSAAIRGIDMSTNIRAVERFLSTIPGVGAALQAAFPVVGALAFAGVLVRMGEELAKFVKEAQEMPQKITAGFESLNLSAQTTNDELNVTNDRIENQIAKLEHKPQNNLKLALDEAKLSADQFAKSIETASNGMIKLIQENKISFASSLVSNNARTGSLAGTIKSFEDDKTHLATQAAIAASQGNAPAYGANQKAFHDKEEAELQKMQAILKDAIGKQYGGDELNQTPIMTMAQGVIDSIQLSRAREASLGTHSADETKLAKDQGDKDAADAHKKAQADLLKQDEESEKQRNAFNKLTINEEIQFWTDRISAFDKGGEQYIAVQDKIYDLIAKRPSLFSENKKTQGEVGKSQVEGSDIMGNANKALQGIQIEQWEKMAEAAKKYNEIVAQGDEIQRKSATSFAETSIAIALAQGSISKLDAAQAMSAIHAHDHADALDLVNKALEEQIRLINLKPDSEVSPQLKTAAISAAQDQAANQRNAINGGYARTQAQDQASEAALQMGPAIRSVLDHMANDWTNATQSIVQIMTRGIDSMNDDIVKAMTGHGKASDFGKTFSQAGEGLLKTSLQSFEGSALKSLGLGGIKKADGSKENPFYTIPAGQAGGLSASATGFFRPFIGGQQQGQGQGQGGQSSGGGSLWGNLLRSFFPKAGGSGGGSAGGGSDSDGDGGGFDDLFQGGFASGGDVLANRPAMVGERGPEMFVPRTAGRIVPNGQLGGGDTHIHVDARGSNDPAAIHAAVMRAAPHIVAASIQSQHASSKRSPQGR